MTDHVMQSVSDHATLDAAAEEFCRAWRECGYSALEWFPGAVDARVFVGTVAQAGMPRWVQVVFLSDGPQFIVFVAPDVKTKPDMSRLGSPWDAQHTTRAVGDEGAFWNTLASWQKRLVLEALPAHATAARAALTTTNALSCARAHEATQTLRRSRS